MEGKMWDLEFVMGAFKGGGLNNKSNVMSN